MIDTNKYEGHTEGPWDKLSEYCPVGSIDKQLIADAPLLLAELKRMQEDTLKVVSQWFEWYGGEENEWRKLELALGLPLTPLSWEGQE